MFVEIGLTHKIGYFAFLFISKFRIVVETLSNPVLCFVKVTVQYPGVFEKACVCAAQPSVYGRNTKCSFTGCVIERRFHSFGF